MKLLALPVVAAFLTIALTTAVPTRASAGAAVALDRGLAHTLGNDAARVTVDKVHSRKSRRYRSRSRGAPLFFGFSYFQPYGYYNGGYYDDGYYGGRSYRQRSRRHDGRRYRRGDRGYAPYMNNSGHPARYYNGPRHGGAFDTNSVNRR